MDTISVLLSFGTLIVIGNFSKKNAVNVRKDSTTTLVSSEL